MRQVTGERKVPRLRSIAEKRGNSTALGMTRIGDFDFS